MSDSYRIKLGVDLDTKGIDTTIKNYQGKPIELKSKLDTSGIDNKIANYKAKKPIEIDTKLNTTGLAKKIGEYKPKTPIELKGKLDTKSINASIKNYNAPPIKVDIKLDNSDISKQIKAYKASASIKVDTKLDTSGINKQIREYKSPAIKINAKLNKNDIDNVIRNYKTKTPVKLDVKINKGLINEQIKSFNPTTTIKLKAALQKGVIAEEIRKFKPSTPIKVDVELDYSDIDKSVGEYVAKRGAIQLPVRLKPATKNFDGNITKNPVKISAILESDDINKAIDNFTPKSKIKVDAKLDSKDINTQIQKLPNPTEPINVKVKLNTENINNDIALFKPIATLGVKPDLILEDVDDQIRAYVPQAKIKVNLDLNDENLNSEIGKQSPQNPIQVNVKLDHDNINEQIKNFSTKTKIKVGVKLDFASHKDESGKEIQKGIAQQIKDFEADTKVKVGVELDRDSVNDEVKMFGADVPIKLGVELDPDGVKNVKSQVSDLRQELEKLEDISININSINSNVSSGGGAVSNTASQVAQQTTNLISRVAESSIRNVTSKGIGRYFKVTPSDSNDFNNEMEKLVNQWTKGKGKLVDVKIETRTSWDKDEEENIERLHQAHVTYQNAVGESIKKTIAWRKIGTTTNAKGQEEDIRGFVEVSAQYSKSIDKTKTKTDNFAKQQKKVATDLTNTINQLNSAARDQNAPKAIKDASHINALETKYNDVVAAITRMRNASRDTFDDERNAVNTLISEYKILVREFKNAESVATSLRSKDISTIKNTYDSKLDVLISKMRKDGVYTSGLERGAEGLRLKLANATDASGLTAFLNGLDKLEAGYKRVSAAKKEFDQAQKVGINVSGLDSKIKDLQRISPEINKFEAEINGAKVTVKSLLNDLSQVKTQGDFSVVNQKFKAFENSAKAAGIAVTEALAKKSDTGVIKEINKEMTNFVKLQTQISNMRVKIGNLEAVGGKTNQVEELKRQLAELENTYDGLMQKFNNKLAKHADIVPTEDIAKFNNEISAATEKAENSFRELDAKVVDTKAKLAEEIKLRINTDITNDISKVHSDFNKLSDKSDELKNKLHLLDDIKIDLNTAKEKDDFDGLIDAANRYEVALKDIKAQLDINKRAEQDAMRVAKGSFDDDKLKQSKISLSLDIDNFLKENSAAAKEFGAKIQEIRNKINDCDKAKLSNLKAEFANIKKEVKLVDKNTQTFTDKLKSQFSKYATYFSISSVFMYATQGLRSMFEQVKLIDSAMTELKKVTNETDASYNKFLSNAAEKSKKLGTTIDGLVSSTADFARLGYGFEDAQGLAEVANIYAVVGDEIEGVEGATQSLVSTLAAFKKEMGDMSDTDFAMSIVDKMNEVANNYAISSGGIGEALQRSASSMAAANNSLDETIALITAANEIAQNPEKVGNAMKTKFLYHCLNVQKCA